MRVRITSEWTDGSDGSRVTDIYELEVDQPYSPDIADDLVRRVLQAVAEDRAERRKGLAD